MKRWGGFGWLCGAALTALGVGGCGDDEDDAGAKDTDVAAEATADSAAEVDDMANAPETLDTSVVETETAVPQDTADTAPETVADTVPIDTVEETTADTTAADTRPDPEPTDSAEVVPGPVTWDDVYPIFATSCTPCHAGATATAGSGGHAIASPNKAVAYDASQLPADLVTCQGKRIGECALVRIQDGSMPASGECQEPVKPKCPEVDEQALIQQWISDGMRE